MEILLTKHCLPYRRTFQKIWDETSGDFEKLGFYLAKTDRDGRYEVAGNSIGDFSAFYAFAEGHGSVVRSRFLLDRSRDDWNGTNEEYASLSAEAPSLPKTSYSDRLFEGSANLPPVVLARTATLRFELTGPDGPLAVPGSGINCNVVVPSLKRDSADSGWHYKPESKDGATFITVPTGVPFDVVLQRVKSNSKDIISITNPLKPGELRDLGRVNWS